MQQKCYNCALSENSHALQKVKSTGLHLDGELVSEPVLRELVPSPCSPPPPFPDLRLLLREVGATRTLTPLPPLFLYFSSTHSLYQFILISSIFLSLPFSLIPIFIFCLSISPSPSFHTWQLIFTFLSVSLKVLNLHFQSPTPQLLLVPSSFPYFSFLHHILPLCLPLFFFSFSLCHLFPFLLPFTSSFLPCFQC